MKMDPAKFIEKKVQYVVALVEVFLVLRLVLRFFNANPANVFVHWVYTNTWPLLHPLYVVFPQNQFGRGYVVDFATLFAAVAYVVVGFLILVLAGTLAHKVSK